MTLWTPPPPQTKVAIAGKTEIYRWKNLVGPFLVHKLSGPRPPHPTPPHPSFNPSVGCSQEGTADCFHKTEARRTHPHGTLRATRPFPSELAGDGAGQPEQHGRPRAGHEVK